MNSIVKPINSLSDYLREILSINVEINKKQAYISKRLNSDMLNIIKKGEISLESVDVQGTIKTILYNLLENKRDFKLDEFKKIKETKIDYILTELIKEYDVFSDLHGEHLTKPFLEKLKLNLQHLIELEEKRTLNSMQSIANEIKQIPSEKIKAIDNMAESFKNFIKLLNENNRIDEFAKIAKKTDNAIKILKDNNWFFDVRYLEQLKDDVINFENDKNGLDNYIISRIGANFIQSKVDEWANDDLMSKRMPIINECIKALEQKQYYVFMCTLYTQLEGIITDAFVNYVPEGGHTNAIFLKKQVKFMEEHSQNKDMYFYDFYCESYLQGFIVDGKKPSLNRNSVLHGYNTDYGTRENAYKLLIQFIYVCDSLNTISLVN